MDRFRLGLGIFGVAMLLLLIVAAPRAGHGGWLDTPIATLWRRWRDR